MIPTSTCNDAQDQHLFRSLRIAGDYLPTRPDSTSPLAGHLSPLSHILWGAMEFTLSRGGKGCLGGLECCNGVGLGLDDEFGAARHPYNSLFRNSTGANRLLLLV